jgi:hypothetical protein
VGPRVGLEDVEKKILHCRESNPGRPARPYTDLAILTPRTPLCTRSHHSASLNQMKYVTRTEWQQCSVGGRLCDFVLWWLTSGQYKNWHDNNSFTVTC